MERPSNLAGAPSHIQAWQTVRRLVVLTTALAMIVAPLVVILTHGPAALAVDPSVTTQMAAHGHVHHHGHHHGPAHDDASYGHAGGALGGHNPADHDHQLHALICQAASTASPHPDKAHGALSDVFRHLTPDGPRRPPRFA